MIEEPAASAQPAEDGTAEQEECPRCGKPLALCICEEVTALDTKTSLLILQHPQEQDRLLGTARLAALHFKDSVFKIGLSWPSLSRILGRPAEAQRWAVLYLGSVKGASLAPERDVVVVDRKGEALANQGAVLREIEGIILLDGTWSQAKALWWRNAWMLKCRRVILNPKAPSRYGKLRREPRRDGLSTIESAAMLMARLERKPDIENALMASFERMLARYREVGASLEAGATASPTPRPSRSRGGAPGARRGGQRRRRTPAAPAKA